MVYSLRLWQKLSVLLSLSPILPSCFYAFAYRLAEQVYIILWTWILIVLIAIVNPNMKMISYFPHYNVIPNVWLYDVEMLVQLQKK